MCHKIPRGRLQTLHLFSCRNLSLGINLTQSAPFLHKEQEIRIYNPITIIRVQPFGPGNGHLNSSTSFM